MLPPLSDVQMSSDVCHMPRARSEVAIWPSAASTPAAIASYSCRASPSHRAAELPHEQPA